MQQILGQPVVVQNVPGGGTRIGARQFQQSPPDGHTLIYMGDANLYAATLAEGAEGLELERWVWVAGVRRSPSAMIVKATLPYTSLPDLIAADRAGTRIRLGNNGVGGFLPLHAVLAELLGLRNLAHVGGYQGTGDLAPAIIRGDVDGIVGTPITSWMQLIRAGDLKAIAVMEPRRYPLLPDVATAAEQGVAGAKDLEILAGSLFGMATVPGTPADRVRVLEYAVLTALRDPGFVQWARDRGDEPDLQPTPGAEYARIKQEEYALWPKYAEVVKKAASG
jgi:tripartite-type tricarboxylate transporter receptor subunit TctC